MFFMFFLFWNVFYVKVLHYYLANVELHYIMSIERSEMWSMFI